MFPVKRFLKKSYATISAKHGTNRIIQYNQGRHIGLPLQF